MVGIEEIRVALHNHSNFLQQLTATDRNVIIKKNSFLGLRELEFEGFGAPLTELKLHELEARYEVTIPYEYRQFLLQIGNGGYAPSWGGLLPLEAALKNSDNRYTLEFDVIPAEEQEQYSDLREEIVLGISPNIPCTPQTAIVLTGSRRGEILTVIGFYPDAVYRCYFFEWYFTGIKEFEELIQQTLHPQPKSLQCPCCNMVHIWEIQESSRCPAPNTYHHVNKACRIGQKMRCRCGKAIQIGFNRKSRCVELQAIEQPAWWNFWWSWR